MDAVLQRIDKEMRDSYEPDWMFDDTCSYAMRYRKSDYVKYQMNDICHARAYPNRDGNATIRSITTSIWRYNDDSKEYVHWLLDKDRSPWRGLFKNMTIHRDGDLIYAVTIDDLDIGDIGCDYVLNFLIASRLHSEKEEEFSMWKEARARGFSEVEALVICSHIWGADGVLYLHVTNRGHFPLDSVGDQWGQENNFINSVTMLEEAKPASNGSLWRLNGSPTPVNGCWKPRGRKPIKYFNQLAVNIARPIYTGMFRNSISQDILERRLKLDIVQIVTRNDDIKLSWDDLLKSKHEWRV